MTWDLKCLIQADRPKIPFLALMALSATVYVGACLALRPSMQVSTLDADEQEYYRLAGDLIHGDYVFSLRRPPVHLLALGLLRLVTFDHLGAVQILVSIIFSFSGPLLHLVARKMTGHPPLALSVGLLTIFWPPFLYYGNTLYSETTALPLFILLLLWLPRGSGTALSLPDDRRACLLSGMALGLCLLVRPMYLLFTPLAAVILRVEEPSWARSLRRIGLVAAACGLVVAPWSLYISTRAGRFILVSANGGETLSGGLNPALVEGGYRTGVSPNGRSFWFGPGKWLSELASGYLSETELQLPYDQHDLLLRRRTLAWVVHHPGSALYLEAAKLLYMWGLYPFWNGAKQTLFGNIPSVLLVALSLLSLLRFRRFWRPLCRFWILPIFVSLVALVSWGSWRFRQPGDLGLIMLGALYLWSFVSPPQDLMARSGSAGPLDAAEHPGPAEPPIRRGS